MDKKSDKEFTQFYIKFIEKHREIMREYTEKNNFITDYVCEIYQTAANNISEDSSWIKLEKRFLNR